MSNFISDNTLKVGFLALTDAAPFLVAQAKGFFAKQGLQVELSREVGWATIREKIIYGELDAAQAPAPMLWSTRLGIESVACPVLTALVLNVNGNALTLSERLFQSGVTDAATLRSEAKRRSGERKLTFGVVFSHSSHALMLRRWLRAAGLNPDKDVRIVVVPPAQMRRNLAAGTIDGYCVGEPYNTQAVNEGLGWCPTWSAQRGTPCVEKVLMVTERFAFQRSAQHQALVAALHAACAWCDAGENRNELVTLLSHSQAVGVEARHLLPALSGRFDAGHGRVEDVPHFISFHRDGTNVPSLARAAQLQRDLIESGLLPADVDRDLPHRVFREDLFHQASLHSKHELVSL